MARCNILKLNDEELVILSDLLELSEESVEKRCREMMDRFDLEVLILTCGVQGSYVFAGDIRSFLDTPSCEGGRHGGSRGFFHSSILCCGFEREING